MRQGFVQEALLTMDPEADTGAPGAAVTRELCGHWEHEPPCPLSPHHSSVERIANEVRVRVLFAVEPELESEIRQRIDRALSIGHLTGPEGGSARWHLVNSTRSTVLPAETEHVQRLTQS